MVESSIIIYYYHTTIIIYPFLSLFEALLRLYELFSTINNQIYAVIYIYNKNRHNMYIYIYISLHLILYTHLNSL